jgi:4-hydroxybenzoate polyprenyltransferase
MLGYAVFGAPVMTFPAEYAFFILIPFALAGNFVDLKDYEGDKKCGIKTFPVLLGWNTSRIVIAVITFFSYANVWYIIRDYKFMWIIEYSPFVLGILHVFLLLRRNYKEWPVVIAYTGGLIALIVLIILGK